MGFEDSILQRNKAMQEMLGLTRSIVSDGKVSDLEARVFRAWLERHPELEGVWPVGEIVSQLRGIFADGHVSEEERARLRTLLGRLSGED